MPLIEIDQNAPAVGTAEAVVKAPIETVWSVLVDLPRWPIWNQSVSRMDLRGDVSVGTTFVWVAGGAKITSRIEELDAPRRIVWSGGSTGIRAIHVWEFEDVQGSTHVHTRESFDGLMVKLFRGKMRTMLSNALSQGVQALKAEAEARHARSSG